MKGFMERDASLLLQMPSALAGVGMAIVRDERY